MRLFILATLMPALDEVASIQGWMQDAFYPALLSILVIASLGIPIPEDIPLIAAGVLMKVKPGIATWEGTLCVALVGIMTGDLVLYSLGRFWGAGVVNHRYVRRLLTPQRFAKLSRRFHRHGVWMVFFGRFFVGIRAAMCLTAGATRYPYARFFLADCAGALLSIPLFVFLGYWFAGMIPTLRNYVTGLQLAVLVAVVLTGVGLFVAYRVRRARRVERISRRRAETRARHQAPVAVPAPADGSPGPSPTPRKTPVESEAHPGG